MSKNISKVQDHDAENLHQQVQRMSQGGEVDKRKSLFGGVAEDHQMEPQRAPRRRLRGVKASAAADTRTSRVQQVGEINQGLSKMLGRLDKIGVKRPEVKKVSYDGNLKTSQEAARRRDRKPLTNPITEEPALIKEKEISKYTPARTHKGDILEEDELCHIPALDEKYVQILQTLKASGQQLRDNQFPPERESLIADWADQSPKTLEDWSKIEWIRADKIKSLYNKDEPLKIFQGKIQSNDIMQGALGDFYFLSALSVISEKSERIEKLFATKQVNAEGVF